MGVHVWSSTVHVRSTPAHVWLLCMNARDPAVLVWPTGPHTRSKSPFSRSKSTFLRSNVMVLATRTAHVLFFVLSLATNARHAYCGVIRVTCSPAFSVALTKAQIF